MLQIKTILLFVFLLTTAPNIMAQQATEFEMEVGARSSDLVQPTSFYTSVKFSRWLNSYFAYTFGGGFSRTSLSRNLYIPNRVAVYRVDSSPTNLFATTGLKLATPTFRNIGLMSDIDFMFSPIPFSLASITASTYDRPFPHPPATSRVYSRIVYTRFNPSYNIQLSAFYTFDREWRLAVGVGFGNYNPLNTYYRAVINDIRLKNYLRLRSERMNLSIFVRFSTISL